MEKRRAWGPRHSTRDAKGSCKDEDSHGEDKEQQVQVALSEVLSR